tara:strand:- start:212 stop:1231 length:1020 start_codon:yes stop_codon:yes gene_type:complete
MFQLSVKEISWSDWHARLHKKLLDNKKLLPTEACLLVSVSGGQDSMALLKLLLDLQRLHKWTIHIWHGDHGWHDKSQQIADELNNWCSGKNLNFHCDHASEEEAKTEKAAREWRYKLLTERADFLSKEAPESPCNHVLTAHTSSDRAETLIMNLARGTDLTGLTSLREERSLSANIQLVRPLLNFSRDETYTICQDLELPIWVDPTNNDLTLKRNKVRQVILPILEDLHKGCSIRIASLAERLTHYQEDQKALCLLAIQTITSEEGLCRKKLINLPISARSTLLAKWLEQLGAPNISSKKIEELNKKIGKSMPPGQIAISKEIRIIWSKQSVRLINESN